jgi:cytochrome c-type biogenesis protein CcmH
MKKRDYLWLLIGLALLTALATQPALAQQPTADDINAIAEKLSCPTCTGISVADCPTETCVQWRDKIGELLSEGKSEQEILDYFSTRYGDHVLQVPPKRGIFVWVWILPALAFTAGLGWLISRMRHWSSRPVSAADEPLIEDEYLQRVQKDLERFS